MIEPVWNVDGVPELPAGYMYRIRRKALGYVHLTLRKKRVFGSKMVSSVVMWPHEFESAEEMIAWGCERAVEKDFENFSARLVMYNVSEYVGDHLSQEDK